ncbi:hypothetical protein ScPMuIL_012970 [Solemya velum]
MGFPYSTKIVDRKIQADARNLKRLPLHIGLLVLESDFSYRDLANIIVWSITMGVSHISVYDSNGEFKRNCNQLDEALTRSREEIQVSETNKYDICFHIHCPDNRGEENTGPYSSNQVNIHLLSLEDGRQSLTEVAKYLCQDVQDKKQKIEDIKQCTVEKLIQDIYKFPDPDLVLKFGHTDSLMGFMPWQIRLTEILSLPSHRDLHYKTFLSTLFLYGKMEQRFGT